MPRPIGPQAPSRWKDSQTGQVYEYDGERWQPVTTYEEWRVTGTWDGEPVHYEFSPTKSPGIDPETGARQVAAQIVGNLLGWTDGPHLHKRTVTVTDWEPA